MKAFTLEDERFLRDNESVAPQVRLSLYVSCPRFRSMIANVILSSKWEMATRAVTTFQDIFSMAVDKDSKLAWAAAHKVIDYVVICYMSGTNLSIPLTRRISTDGFSWRPTGSHNPHFPRIGYLVRSGCGVHRKISIQSYTTCLWRA